MNIHAANVLFKRVTELNSIIEKNQKMIENPTEITGKYHYSKIKNDLLDLKRLRDINEMLLMHVKGLH